MIKRLLSFLDASPVNFLAVKNLTEELQQHGYRRIDTTALGEAEGAAQGVPTVQVKKWPTSNLINVIKEFFFAH